MRNTLTRADGNWVVGSRLWDSEAAVELPKLRIAEAAHTPIVARSLRLPVFVLAAHSP